MSPRFDNTYVGLPERFYERRRPWPVAAPAVLRVNHALAEELGIDGDWLESPAGLAMLAGNEVPEGAEPIALAYAGHQFGQFVPQLGDGRAVLLGEVIDRNGRRRDIQLKGSGPTAFSRGGDGRASIGPVLREYLVSEAMATLGIPTTRTLAAVGTGETVQRETPLPGAVLTRIAASHLRVGTFEYFAARRDTEALRLLVDHALERHYPSAAGDGGPALTLLTAVADAQVSLVTQWMMVGFIHGVMNTDNMTISGETIDYGPCAFMDEFDPRKVFSSIDALGRYAYGNQPRIVQWNMARFAETLLPLIDSDVDKAVEIVTPVLESIMQRFDHTIAEGWCRKVGLPEADEGDVSVAFELMRIMAQQSTDFTLTFRALADAVPNADATSGTHANANESSGADESSGANESPGADESEAERGLRALFNDPAPLDAWLLRWRERLRHHGADPSELRSSMRAINPRFIPRNHRIEEALAAAIERNDLKPFEALLEVLSRPYDDQPENADYSLPPRPDERVTRTFCGT